MNWEAAKKLIGDLAPSVLTAAGSFLPGGAIIGGLAGKILQNAFGTSEPDKLVAAIAADPDAAIKLRMAEIQYQLEETKAYLADVQNARSREVEVVKATGSKDTNLYALAWVTVVGFFVLTGVLLKYSYEGKTIADNTGVLFMLMGAMAANFGAIYNYFFGSSRSSAAKDILLANGKK